MSLPSDIELYRREVFNMACYVGLQGPEIPEVSRSSSPSPSGGGLFAYQVSGTAGSTGVSGASISPSPSPESDGEV